MRSSRRILGQRAKWRRGTGAVLAVAVMVATAGCGTGASGGSAELSSGLGSDAVVLATARSLDRERLPAALSAAGVRLPPGANVYAVVVDRRSGDGRFDAFEAGGGALAEDFWPASSVKLLAAAGALAYLRTLGFTGAAIVSYDVDGPGVAVRSIYRSAIENSSNEAYDRLLEIAGVEWLNTVFLTDTRGFPETVVQRSYTYPGVVASPSMTFSEDGRRVTVAARSAPGGFGVSENGNRSNLRELTESVRRVVLHGVLPPEERFDIDAADAYGLETALLAAEGFIEPAANWTLDDGVLVYKKPGYVVGDDCVDVAYIDDLERPQAYLLGVSTPDDSQGCATLTEVARGTLVFLQAQGANR